MVRMNMWKICIELRHLCLLEHSYRRSVIRTSKLYISHSNTRQSRWFISKADHVPGISFSIIAKLWHCRLELGPAERDTTSSRLIRCSRLSTLHGNGRVLELNGRGYNIRFSFTKKTLSMIACNEGFPWRDFSFEVLKMDFPPKL